MIELQMNSHASPDGATADLAVLYDRASRRLYAYALTLTGDSSRSEDAVHDAFLRLLQYAPGRDVRSLEGFLFTAIRNVILDDRRRRAVRREHPAPLPLAHPSGQPDEAATMALGQLPEEQREAVVLKIYAELTFAAIGEVTGTSTATVASRYRLGIQKLAQFLSKE
jgi:RNA polymerase sigma-70 factor (ECF subfamily)